MSQSFPDIPRELERRVIDEFEKAGGGIYAIAAYEAAVFYSDLRLREEMFAEFELHVEEPRLGEHRLMQYGSAIFALRTDDVLLELRRRLKEHLFRSVFFELLAAAWCKNLGYALRPAPGVNRKGLDYDFEMHPFANTDGAKINVEVTELQSEQLKASSLTNRIKDKSKQLATDSPSVLVCFYPFVWQDIGDNWRDELELAALSYFNNSKRINWIIFIREYVGPDPFGEADYVQHFIAHKNPSPRHVAPPLDAAIIRQFGDTVGRMAPTADDIKQWVDEIVAAAGVDISA